MDPTVMVYRFGQLGDTIAAMPSLLAIRTHFTGHKITLLSEAPAASHVHPSVLLGSSKLVDEFKTYQWERGLGGALDVFKLLREYARADVAALIYLVPSTRPRMKRIRDIAVFRLCGFRNILGTRGFPRDPYPRTIDGKLLPVTSEREALLHRLKLSGILGPEHAHDEIDLLLTEGERSLPAEWLEQNGLISTRSSRWFAVCPGSKWPSKRWPLGNYVEVGKRLMADFNLIPVVVGGKEDIPMGETLISEWGGGFNAAGRFNVRESAALLGQALFYLGNDTGVMHLAAAVGTPCVAVFSAQDWPNRWNPLPVKSKQHRIFRTHVACAGCQNMICPNELRCLSEVDPLVVFEACAGMVGRKVE
jgi:heptosyltransferase-3